MARYYKRFTHIIHKERDSMLDHGTNIRVIQSKVLLKNYRILDIDFHIYDDDSDFFYRCRGIYFPGEKITLTDLDGYCVSSFIDCERKFDMSSRHKDVDRELIDALSMVVDADVEFGDKDEIACVDALDMIFRNAFVQEVHAFYPLAEDAPTCNSVPFHC